MEVSAAGGGEEEGDKVGGAEKKSKNEWVEPKGRMLTMAGLFDIWKSPNLVCGIVVLVSSILFQFPIFRASHCIHTL